MKLKVPFRSISVGWLWLAGVIVLVGIGGFTLNRWWPVAQDWVRNTIAAQKKASTSDEHAHSEGQDGHDHGGHAHAHDE